MRGGWPFWALIVLLVVLHFILHLSLGLGTRAPDLLTVAVLLGARQLPAGGAAGFGFLLGLIQDGVSAMAFGAAAAAETIVGYLGARSRNLFIGETGLFLAVYLFLGNWLANALYYVFSEGSRRGGAMEALAIWAPMWSMYSAAAGVMAILIFRSVRR